MKIRINSSVLLTAVCIVMASLVVSCNGDTPSDNGDGPSNNENGLNMNVETKMKGVNEVTVHELSNPDKIMPMLSTSANSTYIENNIFMALLEIHNEDYTYKPMLAKSRPTMEENDNGGWNITYELREEAAWDNGEPVLASDVDFTLKAIKNPHVNCEHLRNYYEFITDVIYYEDNPKKFTFVTKDKYFMSEIWSAITVYPEYVYDPESIMRGYTIKDLSDPAKKDANEVDKNLIAFADNLHLEKYGRDPEFVVGCGPYKLVEFTTSQRVIVEKKENWWGQALVDGGEEMFYNYPTKLKYEIINDWTTAITSMKDEGIDVMRSVRHKDFKDLQENEGFNELYNMHLPIMLAYNYIGLNMKHPILMDKNVRQALSYATDREYIMDIIAYGYAIPTVGPVNPSKSYYHNDLEPYPYDLDKSKELLAAAGWADADGDGILDKEIDGVNTPLALTIKVSQGSETAQQIALRLQEACKKIGITLDIAVREWTVFIEENKNHDFDMFLGGWVAAPTLSDLKQIWHTQSYNGGSNYVGFGNAHTDDLIEKIRYENDESVRTPMYLEMQEIIHEEQPYIFLYASQNRLCVHKRFEADAYVARPGYEVREFRLIDDFGI